MTRHVVVLNQFALPRTEGGGTRHVDIFGRVAGWTVTIIAAGRNNYSQARYRTDDRRFRLVPVPAHHSGAASRLLSWTAYSVQAFLQTVLARPLDVVYASTPHLLTPLVGLVAARVRRVPYVLEVRDLWPESLVAAGAVREGSRLHRALAMLERLVARRAGAVVVVTDGWGEHFAALGVPAERLHVVTNGAEVDDFTVPESREKLREQLGLHGFTSVFAGAHGPKDGIDLVLDAAQELPEVTFLLVGDGPVKPAAQARARSDGLTNVRFLDPVPKRELASILKACDVGIHAVTPYDVFSRGMSPNKLFDYLAAGLPIVSNAGEGIRSVVVDGECGPVGGPTSLADGLRRVLEASDDQVALWRRRATELMRERFSRNAAAERIRGVLVEVSSPRPGTTRRVTR